VSGILWFVGVGVGVIVGGSFGDEKSDKYDFQFFVTLCAVDEILSFFKLPFCSV
jgi:hypothetical protein